MKKFILIALVAVTSVSFNSCNTDDEDDFPFSAVLGTYTGAMNVTDPDFTNAQYAVVVSQVSSSVIRIEPAGTAGSDWTAHLTKIAGVYTCISCALSNQITITDLGNTVQLSYNYDENNEQFLGVK
ncbi:MAG: hypothetical protein ACPGU4_06985 [Flavobacteriales bacterium]